MVKRLVFVGSIVALACSLLSASWSKAAVPSDAVVNRYKSVTAKSCDELTSAQRATLVIVEPSSGRRLVCNPTRAATRFIPASTYKIPHTLIALETQAVASIDETFSWDSRDRGVPVWNRNLTVKEAVAVSAVWVFQAIATRIGSNTEHEWLETLQYGNEDVGKTSDLQNFWLSGPLTISADEQVDFLTRLVGRELPVSETTSAQTIQALHVSETADGHPIYGKTGAMLPIDNDGFLRTSDSSLLPAKIEKTGWFVGWIDRPQSEGGPIYFAHNLDLSLPDAMSARTRSVYVLLARNGFPAPSKKN